MRISLHNKLALIFGPRPPLNWLLLCVVSVCVLIVLLGSSSNTYDPGTDSVIPVSSSKYRKLKEQALNDYLELQNLGQNRAGDFILCGKEKENYVPCYNVSANLLAGLKDGDEFDRHCEISRDRDHCLIRPPKDYKTPLTWPTGRDIVWSGNVKLSKDQFLSSGSMTKRLIFFSLTIGITRC